ncbi:MAG TPA: nucleotide sugar dehydrogenase [Candidatus Nanoarchaeia archaeon]|nr:nucleotide sugar dehydrogenase [Candidatus Nanoarchaeia archaeon]
MSAKKRTVAVIGLGYIGIPFVAALANVGYYVVGVDIDNEKVRKLSKSYISPLYEPDLDETLKASKDSIEFTSDYSYAMKKCESVFITVGTPLSETNQPDYKYVDLAIDSIGPHLKPGHIIILKSTVIPGTTEEYVKPRLEKLSGLVAGKDFFLGFCPERTLEGRALYEIYNLPKIIGGINQESTKKITELMAKLGGKIITVSNPSVAEMCKLVDNSYRAMNIGFANEVGMVCEKTGISAHEVVSAVNDAYARTNMFRPGLGANGPCLSKDPVIFSYSAQKHGITTEMINSSISINKKSDLRLASIALDFLKKHGIKKPRVALVGLAFKGFPETDDTRESAALKIRKSLLENNPDISFSYHDPLVKEINGQKVVPSIFECTKRAHVVMFLTNHPRIMNVDSVQLVASLAKPCLIIDSWRNVNDYNKILKQKDVSVFRIGIGE